MTESAESELIEEPPPQVYRLKRGKVPLALRLKSWWQGVELREREEEAPPPAAKSDAAESSISIDQEAMQRLKEPWQPERLAMAQRIWGEGFVTPGGPEYVEYMVKPFGLTNESVVLDIGAALGGPARLMAKEFDSWVTGLESDPRLAQEGMALSTKAGLAKKAVIEHFEPGQLSIRESKYHCIFSKEALYRIGNQEELLPRIQKGLKPRGQLLFSDFVLAEPDTTNKALEAWSAVHSPAPEFWTKADYVSRLEALNFDVRVDEDITDRLRSEILKGCMAFVDSAAKADLSRVDKVAITAELEYWARCVAALESDALGVCRIYCLAP